MTIEIRQLVIRAVVEEAPSPAAPAAIPSTSAGALPAGVEERREALVAECTRQVLRLLRKGRER